MGQTTPLGVRSESVPGREHSPAAVGKGKGSPSDRDTRNSETALSKYGYISHIFDS